MKYSCIARKTQNHLKEFQKMAWKIPELLNRLILCVGSFSGHTNENPTTQKYLLCHSGCKLAIILISFFKAHPTSVVKCSWS